jgi:hypothetical protein
MSSVAETNPAASTNPGLAETLQLLSNSGSPQLSSLLSSPSVQSALSNASPSDLVKLSDQALQLQVVEGLFGESSGSPSTGIFGDSAPSDSSSDSSTTLASILSQLNPSATASSTGSAAATPTPSIASQLAIYQGQLQSEDTQALFGSTTGTSGTSVNLLG